MQAAQRLGVTHSAIQICVVVRGEFMMTHRAPPPPPPPPPPLQCSSRAHLPAATHSMHLSLHLVRPFTILRIPVILCNRRILKPLHPRAWRVGVLLPRLLWPFPYFCPLTTMASHSSPCSLCIPIHALNNSAGGRLHGWHLRPVRAVEIAASVTTM